MRLLDISLSFCLACSTFAGVVPQSHIDIPDIATEPNIDQDRVAGIEGEDGAQNLEADISDIHRITRQNDKIKTHAASPPDVKDQHLEPWKNGSSQGHRVKNAKNSKSEEPRHSKHHNHHHTLPHKSEDHLEKNMHKTNASSKENSEPRKSGMAASPKDDEQLADKYTDRLSKRGPATRPTTAAPKKSTSTSTHKSSSIASRSAPYAPDVVHKSSTAHNIHDPSSVHSSSMGHPSAGNVHSSTVSVAHKASTSKTPSISKGKGKTTLQNKMIYDNGPLKVDPGSIGPQSNTFLKGPYAPTFDFYNLSSTVHIGDQIDPAQKQLWDQQGITHNRGVPPGSKLQILTSRDVETCPPDDDGSATDGFKGECKMSANTAASTNKPRSLGSKSNDQSASQRSVSSRLSTFVKRVTIGGMSSIVGIVKQPANDVPQQYIVFNGQPGMIWLKQKGDITECPADSHNQIVDDYKVYVPSVFYTDTSSHKRCNQPCYLFWVTGNGPVIGKGIQMGSPNFVNVVIAGQCNDCYPWEIQAEGVVISAIASNLTIDWNKGLWGPTLALGINDNFYSGNKNDL